MPACLKRRGELMQALSRVVGLNGWRGAIGKRATTPATYYLFKYVFELPDKKTCQQDSCVSSTVILLKGTRILGLS